MAAPLAMVLAPVPLPPGLKSCLWQLLLRMDATWVPLQGISAVLDTPPSCPWRVHILCSTSNAWAWRSWQSEGWRKDVPPGLQRERLGAVVMGAMVLLPLLLRSLLLQGSSSNMLQLLQRQVRLQQLAVTALAQPEALQ